MIQEVKDMITDEVPNISAFGQEVVIDTIVGVLPLVFSLGIAFFVLYHVFRLTKLAK